MTYVNQGLQRRQTRFFSGTGAAPSHIAASSDATAVIAASTSFGGTVRFAAFGAPVVVGNTTTVSASFTKGAGAGQIDFVVQKVGISAGSTDGNAMDIIGGTGNEPFSIDVTTATSFTLTIEIDTLDVAT